MQLPHYCFISLTRLCSNRHPFQDYAILCAYIAGTGMSYSETRSDYVTNDTHTAQDSNKFIRGFLEQYPQYAKNDFYIIGQILHFCHLI